MDDFKIFLWACVAYAIIFFLMALKDAGNLKDAFWGWIETIVEWIRHALPGVIFLIVIAIICWAMAKS